MWMDEKGEGAFAEIIAGAIEGNRTPKVRMGFADLDRYLGGMEGGDIGVIAARPGIGKTSFLLNVAANVARTGVPVIYFSLEVGADRLVKRMLSSATRIPYERLEQEKLREEDFGECAVISGELSRYPIQLNDDSVLTVAKIREHLEANLSDDLPHALVIVDYLQLIKPEGHCLSYGNRTYEVDDIVRSLKWLAREFDVPMLVASSLSRASVERDSARPVLTDLRESGSIEQVADFVVMIDRSLTEDESEEPDRPDLGVANLIIAKNRHGRMGECYLTYDPDTFTFYDYIDESI